MNRFIISLILASAVGPVRAELHPPVRTPQQVTDTSMVVMDRGAMLEVYPTKRAMPQADGSGRVIAHQVIAASANDTIGPLRLGVVFNHALQQQGYITGEIAFKMKAGHTAEGFTPSLYPGLKKITSPEVYVVNARTPAEFLKVLKRLQARSDLEWVEPTVTYGAGQTDGVDAEVQPQRSDLKGP
jgi:hypothetical protein